MLKHTAKTGKGRIKPAEGNNTKLKYEAEKQIEEIKKKVDDKELAKMTKNLNRLCGNLDACTPLLFGALQGAVDNVPTPSNPAHAILLGAMKGAVGSLPTVYENLKNQNNGGAGGSAAAAAAGSITGAGAVEGSFAGGAETGVTGGAHANIKNSADYYYTF